MLWEASEATLLFSTSTPTPLESRCVISRLNIGRVDSTSVICYIYSLQENYSFRCHRTISNSTQTELNIYAVNDVKIHPKHGTLATVGSDGTFSYWNKDTRTKMTISKQMAQPITSCCFNHDGKIFAYSVGYEWSKGHKFNDPPEEESHLSSSLHINNDKLKYN